MKNPSFRNVSAVRRIFPAAFLVSLSVFPSFQAQASEPADSSDARRPAVVMPDTSERRSVQPRWYGGVALEAAHNQDLVAANNDGSLSGIAARTSSTAFRVFSGYSFTNNLGLEAGYLDLGKSSFTAESSGGESWAPGRVGTDFEADGWYLEGVVAIPITPRWTLFARIGAFRWETQETFFEESLGTTVDHDSGTTARYGIGVEYDIGEENRWVLRSDVMQTKVDHDHDTVTTAGLNLVRKF